VATNSAEMSKTEDRSQNIVEDLLPLIKQARHSNDIILKADVARLSSMAAATLGGLPKSPRRRWTGWGGQVHYWRGRKVILPTGQVAEVIAMVRGKALLEWRDPYWLENVRREVLPVDRLSVYKNPAAVWMGKLKIGCRERPSELKAYTARQNGRKRPGRPKRVFEV
jgi:hypothetical protein